VLQAAGHVAETLLLGTDNGVGEATFPATFDGLAGRRHRTALRRRVAAFAPDLIHVHAGFTSLSAVLLRDLAAHTPTVGQFHDVGSFCYLGTRRYRSGDRLCERRVGVGCWSSGCYRPQGLGPKLRGIGHSLVRADLLAAWRALHRIVLPSAYLLDLAVLHGFAPDRVRVVPNFQPSAGAQARAPDDVPLILFVGSLLPVKGAHLALQALGRLTAQPWQAVFAGDGVERANLERQCRELGMAERVRFTGALERDAIGALYDRCRMLVHASVIPESFGLVGIEAMARGVPVVGFDLGGVKEWLVDGETGIAVSPWSVEGLARGIERLLREPALAAELGQAAQARVGAHFTTERFLAATLTVYAETVEQWRKQRKA